jgi:hypothetical protein
LGIGTSSPANAIDSNGAFRLRGATDFTGVPTSGVGLELYYNTDTNTAYNFSYNRNTSQYQKIGIEGSFTMLNGLSNGNVGIGTTTDAGFKLDVNGTARVQNTLRLGITGIAGEVLLSRSSDGLPTAGVRAINSGVEIGGSGYLDRIRCSNGQGISFFTFSSGSSSVERMYITNGNGNILINTTTDAGFRLDVNGTARVQGQLTTSLNQNASTRINISNTTSGTASNSELLLTTNSSASLAVGKANSSYTPYKTIAAGDSYIYNSITFGDLTLLNDFATGRIKFAAGGASTAQMILKASGVLNLSSVPTSATGLSAGDIWNDGGTLKIV